MKSKNIEKLRAHYSNERTLLSYIRTFASVAVLAVALLKFFEDKRIIYIGWAVLIAGIIILLIGLRRYFQERKHINTESF